MVRENKIQRLLVANRGEIAIRIVRTARELGIYTITVYTPDDSNHAVYADEATLLELPTDFTDISKLVDVAIRCKVDAVHPGYGFLSESADFASTLTDHGIQFIGPSADILRQTGDKTAARALAISNNVPVLPASKEAIADLQEARHFAGKIGYPVMIKAVDGGGGRGIRLVRKPEDLEDSFNRACGESPSRQVFIEKAAVSGFRHVEVQILGDQHGHVAHLWERECSIQRRYQKIVELAPSSIRDRKLIGRVIDSAMALATAVQYSSLGTFEFLVHESKPEYYFLEVNPRLQVEHTISEEITSVDIVRCQLLLAQGASIDDLHLPTTADPKAIPEASAIQLRITAEDAAKGFSLSMGRISGFQAPGGPGVRVDTHLSSTRTTTVGSSYDSLLAKLIVKSTTFEAARLKALRALSDTVITGVNTNLNVLMGIVSSPDFRQGRCSTNWLESSLEGVIANGKALFSHGTLASREQLVTSSTTTDFNISAAAGLGTPGVLFRKGDAFKLEVTASGRGNDRSASREEYLLRVDRILTNNFPNLLAADMTFSTASTSQTYAINLTSTTQTSVASSRHRIASANDPSHIALPYPGQFVELLVEERDKVREGEVLCVVRQMKMELEVRAPWAGTVKWVCDVEDGETVNEGLLVCELMPLDEKSLRKAANVFKL